MYSGRNLTFELYKMLQGPKRERKKITAETKGPNDEIKSENDDTEKKKRL